MSRGAWLEVALFAASAALFAFGFGLTERAVPAFDLGAKPPAALRVVTWNVGGSGTGEAWGRPLDDDHLEHVAAVLRELDPDLAILQELRSGRQAERLRDALGEGWRLELAPLARGRRVAALARRGTLEPASLAGQSLGDPSRGSLAVRYAADGGRSVLAVGVHADATSAERRNQELGALAAALDAHRGEARLLLGDLNLDLDLDKRRDLFTDDAYLDVETYNVVASGLRDAARGGGSTAEPDRRLDYVFVDERAFTVRSAGPVRGRRVGDMDHDPVAADLGWRD